MKRRKRVLLIAGLPGSGKSVFSKVAQQMSIPVVSLGDIVREEALKRKLDLTSENLGKIAIELRERYGKEVMAKRSIVRILYNESPLVVVDGVRSLEEVYYFKKFFEVYIIAIHASPRTRYSRLKARGRPDDPSSWEEFSTRDLRELSLGIGNVIALADYMIVNENIPLREYEEICRKILLKTMREICYESRG